MDGRQFDSLTRAFARKTTRRRFILRGALVAGVGGSIAGVDSVEAARRGASGSSAICRPDGAGGYYRDLVPTFLLGDALRAGAIESDCCTNAECGASNACMDAVCDLAAGACVVSMFDGVACARPGCANGVCSGGTCLDPTPFICAGDGICNICTYDACAHRCNCRVKACFTDDFQCTDAYCSTAAGGCVTEPINEGSACDTFGVEGICTLGYCTVA